MTVAEQNINDAVMAAESLAWLAAYLQGVVDSGFAVADLIGVLGRASLVLRERENEAAADLVLDGLDLLTGWCGPGHQILPSHTR